MNKLFALMLTAVFALTGIAAANTTTTTDASVTTEAQVETLIPEEFVASGTVIELDDVYVIFTTADGQTIQANIDENTYQEFDLPGGQLAVGDFIHVTYDGKMTRSMPGQVYAQSLRAYVRQGEITAMDEASFMLKTDVDEIQVNCTAEQLASVQQGQQVKVYFSGAMTMSIPAQIGADLIVPAE